MLDVRTERPGRRRAAPTRVPAWKRALRVLTWLLLIASAAMLLVTVLVPRIAGATPYTILTGSMQPDLPPGTLVVVKPVDVEDIQIGSVITYQLESGEAAVVTHRVVGVTQVDGETAFITQGDANPVADTAPVQPVQIRGELWYHVPYLGRASALLSVEQRKTGVYVVAGMLAAWALTLYGSSLRERLRQRREPVAEQESAVKERETVDA